MTVAELPVKIDSERIATFCLDRGIRRLSLFGSVLRADFDPTGSDLDVLVEYLPGQTPGLDFITHQEELSCLLGARVDLNTPRCLNERLREVILGQAALVYEQT